MPAAAENLFLAWISRMPHAEEQVDINWAHWSQRYCLAKNLQYNFDQKATAELLINQVFSWCKLQQHNRATSGVQQPPSFCTALQWRLEHQKSGGKNPPSIPILLLCKHNRNLTDVTISLPGSSAKFLLSDRSLWSSRDFLSMSYVPSTAKLESCG